jgi:hypothetical protein
LSGREPATPDYVRSWSRRAHGSPLYRVVGQQVADDEQLMDLIRRIEHWPPTNLLFASVQYLLMKGSATRLRNYYASLVDDPDPPEEAGGPFKEFVLEHQDWIVENSNRRYTQTNESKRCVALLPAIWSTGLERFHLVEIGASAGLNLAIDHYRYRWDGVEWGPSGSPVVLEAASRGGRPRPRPIEVLSRTGLDLNPIDLEDPDERSWLLALIWPEHTERRARLEKAIEIAKHVPMRMVEGDATETLNVVLTSLPEGDPVVVMNSMALMQFARSQRESLYRTIEEAGSQRPVRRVSFEILAAGDEWVTIASDAGRGLAQIGQAHPHGEWVELYARP